MLIEGYIQMRIEAAESILASAMLVENGPKVMVEEAVIAELKSLEDYLGAEKSVKCTSCEKPAKYHLCEEHLEEHFDFAIICECGDHINESDPHAHCDGKNYCQLCLE